MILTNTSAHQFQIEHNRSKERINTAFQRISSGKRITGSSTDAGSLSQSKSLHSEILVAQSELKRGLRCSPRDCSHHG